MTSKLKKFTTRCRNEGLLSGIRAAFDYVAWNLWLQSYNFVRPWLPRRLGSFNGVIVRDLPPRQPTISTIRKYCQDVFQTAIFQRPFIFSEYESALSLGLRKYATAGDDVTIVGGGRGVTAVVASDQVGDGGFVTVYEAALEKVTLVRETLELNNANNVTVREAAVGDPLRVWGPESSEDVMSPGDLSECDVLELDCEGAEVEILSSLAIRPEAIIVETHGVEDPLNNAVTDLLDKLGYSVVHQEEENVTCGCYVLFAERD